MMYTTITNLLTEQEQLERELKRGNKVKVGLLQLGKIEIKPLETGIYKNLDKRKEYMRKYAKTYQRKYAGVIAKRKAFAYKWTLQIELLLK